MASIDIRYYFLLCYFLTFLLLYISLFRKRLVDSRVYLILVVILFFLTRFFVICFNRQLNPDESHMITQAFTLRSFPVAWKSIDPTTGGPLLSYMLIIPTFIGFGFDFINAHFLAAVYLAASIVLTFGAVKNWYGARTAQVSILPVLAILSFTQNAEFLHYSSELLSILLISAGLNLYSKITTGSSHTRSWCFLSGFLLGCIPFAKLQAVPMGLVVGIFMLFEVWKYRRSYSGAIWLLLGSLTFPALFVSFLWLNGALENMVNFYIIGNLSYDHSYMSVAGKLVKFLYVSFNLEKTISLFLLLMLPALVYFAQFVPKRYRILQNRHLIFLSVFLFSCIYSISKSGAFFPHYYLFLFFCGTLIHAYFVHHIVKNEVRAFSFIQALLVVLTVVIIKQGPAFNYEMRISDAMSSTRYALGQQELEISDISRVIRKYSSPKDFLVIWGWGGEYYVQSQRMQGTMLNHRDISTDFDLANARALYVSDMARTKPKVFIDINHRADEQAYVYEKFPALKQYIDAHYNFYGKVDRARIFIRNDVPLATNP